MPRRVKGAPPGKRYPLNMRTTRDLREKVEAAARASGRSLVQEVEHRLERSFDPVEPVFDPHHVDLFRHIASAIALVERQEGKRWIEDQSTTFFALRAVRHTIDSLTESLTKNWTARQKIAHLLSEAPLSENQANNSKPETGEDK